MTLLVAILGVALATLSLGWQAASFFLSGSRVRAKLQQAFIGRAGAVTAPLDAAPAAIKNTIAQGFTQPALAIVVTNRGRLPAEVAGWSISFENEFGYSNPTDPINPPLPYRLEGGTSKTWYARGDDLSRVVAGSKKPEQRGLVARGYVSLGTGRRVKAKGAILLGP